MPRKSGLNATTKAALEKFLIEGKDVSEIAEIMAKPVSTVYRWIRISGLSGLTEGIPWVDAYTGMPITIPDKPERSVECIEWMIIGSEQGLNDDEAFSDPQGLWTLFSYVLNCRDKPVRTPLKVKYLGPKNGWKKGIDEILKRLDGLYGCDCTDDQGQGWLTPYYGEPAGESYKKLKNAVNVRRDCQYVGGTFINLKEYYSDVLHELVELLLK